MMFERLKSALSGNAAPSSRIRRTAPLVESPQRGITFAVDDVQAATKPLWAGTLRESLELRSGACVLIMPDQPAPALAPEGYYNQSLDQRTGEGMVPLRVTSNAAPLQNAASGHWADRHTFLHPVVQAVHLAFSDHRPLVLSPDDIWLTIVQGFARHVRENAESLRSRIVRHHGKASLRVKTRSLDPDRWPEFVSQFSDQIRDRSEQVLHETLLCDFSTTTPTIRTACEIAQMDAYQRYFEYTIECVCGIPAVTLEGTPEDWQRLRDRVEVLATYKLEWWTSRLTPILDEFIATAKGQPDRCFWQAIYKPSRFYFSDRASGWITDLFPYVGREDWSRPNPMLEETRVDWLPAFPKDRQVKSSAKGEGYLPAITLDSFPSGLSRAPVKLELPDASQSDVELLGGFLGVSQRPDNNAIAPMINWAVVKPDSRPQPSLGELDPALAKLLAKRKQKRTGQS